MTDSECGEMRSTTAWLASVATEIGRVDHETASGGGMADIGCPEADGNSSLAEASRAMIV